MDSNVTRDLTKEQSQQIELNQSNMGNSSPNSKLMNLLLRKDD